MSGNTENFAISGKPPRLYSLQDLQRVGPNPPDGLYTMNQLGRMLLYLKLLTAEDGLCDECLRMGTGEKPCPHGHFTADTRLAPILIWPEDQLRAGFTRSPASNDDFEYWVTVNETSNCDPVIRPFSPSPFCPCIEGPGDSTPGDTLSCSQAFELEGWMAIQSGSATTSSPMTFRTRTSSSVADLAASASPFCTASLASFSTMITTSSSLPPSSSAPSFGADTVPAMSMTGLSHVYTERPTPSQQFVAHPLTSHVLQPVDHGSHNPMQLAIDWPVPLDSRNAILGDHMDSSPHVQRVNMSP